MFSTGLSSGHFGGVTRWGFPNQCRVLTGSSLSLKNRVFKSYDDLVDHCCEAWNKLVDQPWRIMGFDQ
jgi:hypothetical protein